MSWEHGTYGWEKYDGYVAGLVAAGIEYTEVELDYVYVKGWDGNCQCYCGYDPKEPHRRDVKLLGTLFPGIADLLDGELEAMLQGVPQWIALGLTQAREIVQGGSCPCCRGTCGHKGKLRRACFTNKDGKSSIVEEYLALKDCDCDGQDAIGLAVYDEGHRPELTAEVLEAH